MSLSIRLAVVGLLAVSAVPLAAVPAEAHGWRRHHHHHHHHDRHHHHRGWLHSYAPRHHWTSVGLPGWGCGLRQFITPHGALAYREVCY